MFSLPWYKIGFAKVPEEKEGSIIAEDKDLGAALERQLSNSDEKSRDERIENVEVDTERRK